MKVLLYIDDYCFKCQNSYYAEEFCLILINRYLAVFEEVVLAIRVRVVDQSFLSNGKVKYVGLSDNRIGIIEIPYGRGINDYLKNFSLINKTLRTSIKKFDLAIIRIPSIYAFTVLHYVSENIIPYAVEAVADCYDLYKTEKNFLTKYAWYIMHNLQKRHCRKAIGVAYVTENYLQQHYPIGNNVKVCASYSSIELPKEWYTSSRTYPHNKEFNIIHLSYHVFLNSSKGHRQLLDVLSVLKQSRLSPKLIFVGNASTDNQKEIIEYAVSKGVENQITFAGFLGREELHSLLTNVDLAVLPTKSEGLPRVVIESMAVGLPCVSTRVGGIPELLSDAFLVEMSDTIGFANVVEKLIRNPELYETTSMENFQRSLLYEASELNKKRSDFYNQLKEKINNNPVNN